MPDTLEKRRGRRLLNTDGGRHPLQNALTLTAFVLGVAALVLGFIPATHFFGALAGVIGLPVALYAQLISDTTGERFFNVIAMICAFVGAAFALRHGGFSL
ncbi:MULTISPECIES: hypothetical protein [Thermomonospora]|mgnify:CR=1 FL=1|uniref:FUSC family protein n=1 Tax=Thermomonospora curvata (strain ATCC 19995 / DSM 43183 / JCM 3096 / KCTC 9072 / NBRC 15933 / NCIMB 10081 / Henssen B9) TaxID=471852 RepID=D1A8F2_THECD|nr:MULTISPECIES: hypothetical protein [Thermomonospora]ACZ00467.1 hypothetical protein Tcur_4951 [Thermomonospora curvata DSM 43183]PKK11847.1 MAG: hypothetical protein BUE48_023935 [Thermomonospora sp. CIF 1]